MDFSIRQKTRIELISDIVELQQENRRLHDLLETAPNSDYAKCLDTFLTELYSKNAIMMHRGEVENLAKRHFA